MNNIKLKLCNCESGLERYELTDSYGIFCTYVCNKCENQKKSKFRPDIFTSPYDSDESIEENS